MGKRFFFELKSLPDFSLTRYQAINLSDLGSVVKNNNVFLRQLHSLGLVLNMSFHLYYSFIPHLPHGERIKVVLMCQEESEKETVSYDILIDIISSFANASCYKLTKYEYAHLPATLSGFSGTYNCFCTISKKENLTNPYYSKNTPKNGMQYYSISEWTAKQNARMYNSIKLLGNYKSDTVIRIDIYPVPDPNEILDSISKRGIYSMIQEEASFKAFNNSSGLGVSKRDEAANRANSFYENYFKTMSSSLQFNASINIFGNSEDNCRLLGDFLCSEVLEKGLISQRCELGKYAADYLLDAHKLHNTMEDSSGYKVPEMASRFTIDEIAPFFSFPYLYPSENIGIRKETDPDLSGEGIVIGTNSNGYCVRIPLKAFAKHAYISGVPGSGKTFTMKHIIHCLSKEGIPFLVFEPAKREYRGLYDVCKDNKKAEYGSFYDNEKTDDIILLCPKTNSLFPLNINPFEIPVGISVNDYASTLFDVFNGAFSWPQPTPMILKKAILRAYKKCGFYGSEVITEERRESSVFPTMNNLFDAFRWIMDNDSSYKGEVQGNIKGVLETRIGSLMEGNMGEIFNSSFSTLKPEDWINKQIILELENLSGEHANFITLLIVSLIRLNLKMNPTLDHLKKNDTRRVHELRHVIFFEEAHNLIGKKSEADDPESTSSKIASTAFIKNMLAEVRAYKEGIVIADQLPTAIAPEVLKNTSIKIAHKQTAADEREAIGSVMSADGIQLENITKFEAGEGLLIFDGVTKPFEIRVETEFEYSSDTQSDVSLAKKLSATSEWYKIDEFIDHFNERYKKAAGTIDSVLAWHNNWKIANCEMLKEIEQSVSENSANEFLNKFTQSEVSKAVVEFNKFSALIEPTVEEFHRIKSQMIIMLLNDIGDFMKCRNLLQYACIYIEASKELMADLSQFSKQAKTVITIIKNTER